MKTMLNTESCGSSRPARDRRFSRGVWEIYLRHQPQKTLCPPQPASGSGSVYRRASQRSGFTLVEMLTVIAVVGILATLVIGLSSRVGTQGKDSRTRAMLRELEVAIDDYKDTIGYYPPDNPNSALMSPLYYELVGTKMLEEVPGDPSSAAYYVPAEGTFLKPFYASRYFDVEGFVNTVPLNADREVRSFMQPGKRQNAMIVSPEMSIDSTEPIIKLLTVPVTWPVNANTQPLLKQVGGFLTESASKQVRTANPWRYVSKSPLHNPGSYDLWAEIWSGKGNDPDGVRYDEVRIISNWSDDVIVERRRTQIETPSNQ